MEYNILKSIAKLDFVEEDMIVDPNKINFHQWAEEFETDDVMLDTLLDLRDCDNRLLNHYSVHGLEDIQNHLLMDEEFQMFPQEQELSYFLGRHMMGLPVRQNEINQMKEQRHLVEKNIEEIKKKHHDYKRKLSNSRKTPNFENKKIMVDF